jgi:PKD repeat protein
MTSDSGNLSIDFLAGFTIFILAFIWVVAMIPGLLIGLQSYTIDYDAVAYRTGVILVEDPGEPALPKVPWENNNKRDVIRFGLAVSKETPNILSQEKVNKFFCSSVFAYPDDYQKRAIFGDYPYRFNISLLDIEENKTLHLGDSMSGSYGTIRRLVQIKGTSNATINYSYMNDPAHDFINGDNETQHEFSIVVNNTKLLHDKVRDPAYQINPAREILIINITDINSTLGSREMCFDINLTKIYAKDEKLIPIHLFNDPVIDGVPYQDVNTEAEYEKLPYVKNNVSLILDPTFLPWSNYPQVYFNLTFNLVKNTTACPGSNPLYNFSGSQFLNNTYSSPFDYNYHPDNVTQPSLRDAILEVNIGSGSRTPSEIVIESLIAKFKYELTGGTTVKFTDLSTGSPVEWNWVFGDGNTSTLSDPTHTYPGPGTYTVLLTVTDSDGNSNGPVSQNVDIFAPVAALSGTPLSGAAPLTVSFTDGSVYVPTTWNWEYKETAGSWTTFSTVKNPSHSFSSGTYDIRLTATNAIGSNTATMPGYVTAIPLPVTSFTADQTSGVLTLPVQFTDTSAGNPTSWVWEFNETTAGSWTQFSTAQNATHLFTTGNYDIRLTGTNAVGSDTMTKFGYITVTAVPISHTITASAAGSGTISPTGAVILNEGGSQIFTITPNAGSHTTSVLVDGVAQVPIPGSYTFNNVIADHSISATFVANTPVVIFSDNFNAGFSGWTSGGTPGVPDWYAGAPRNGSHSIQLVQTERITRSVSTAGYSNIIISCAIGANSLENGETVQAQYSTDGGTNYVMWDQIRDWEDDNALHNFLSPALPAAANDNPNFRLRFRSYGSGTGDYGYIDDVVVTGTPI